MTRVFPTDNTLPVVCGHCYKELPPSGNHGVYVPGHTDGMAPPGGELCRGSYLKSAAPTNERL